MYIYIYIYVCIDMCAYKDCSVGLVLRKAWTPKAQPAGTLTACFRRRAVLRLQDSNSKFLLFLALRVQGTHIWGISGVHI